MGELIKLRTETTEEYDEPSGIRKIASIGSDILGLGGSVADAFVRNRDLDLSPEQKRRFGRMVGNTALVAANFYDRPTMYERMEHVADGLENARMLRKDRPLIIRTVWRTRNPDVEVNQRMLETADVLREVLHDRGVMPHVSARPEYPYGKEGSESSRALEALNRSMRDAERMIGYSEYRPEPLPGDVGYIAMIHSGWARAFRGVNAHQLYADDGFVMLNGAGPSVDDIRWIAPSIREILKQPHD